MTIDAKYKILKSTDSTELEEDITLHINMDYLLGGSLTVVVKDDGSLLYIQALVRPPMEKS